MKQWYYQNNISKPLRSLIGHFTYLLLIGTVLALLFNLSSEALVLHSESEPSATPPDSVIGRWGTTTNPDHPDQPYNASCVVVSPNYILTVRHPSGGAGQVVYIEDMPYIVAEAWTEPTGADLQVCRIETPAGNPANLTEFAVFFSGNEANKTIVMGGYGRGRAGVFSDSCGEGYGWSSGNNQPLRWGTNQIPSVNYQGTISVNTSCCGTLTSDILIIDFDLDGTAYEAAAAEWDSGGGWFYHDGGEWKLMALSAYVHCANNASRHTPAEKNYGIRLTSYAHWIQSMLVELDCTNPPVGDITGDCRVSLDDLLTLATWWLEQNCASENCGGSDIAQDDKVNLADLAALANDWLACGLAPAWGCEN